MRKFLTVLLCIGMLISWQIFQGDDAKAQENMGKPNGNAFECSIAGTWLTVGIGKNVVTIIPLDPTGRRFTTISEEFVPEDPTLDGFFPEAVHVTGIRGDLVKTSKNTYDFSQYEFGSDENDVLLYTVVISGSTKFIDCDRRVTAFSIDLILPDGSSFCVDTGTSQSKRIKIVPPCTDLPDFPEFIEDDGN